MVRGDIKPLPFIGMLTQFEGFGKETTAGFKLLSVVVNDAQSRVCEREIRVEVGRHLVKWYAFVVLALGALFLAEREHLQRSQGICARLHDGCGELLNGSCRLSQAF